MYEDVIDDLIRQLASASAKEAARIRTRIKEIKRLRREHAST